MRLLSPNAIPIENIRKAEKWSETPTKHYLESMLLKMALDFAAGSDLQKESLINFLKSNRRAGGFFSATDSV
jgi:hypothetical protein